MGVMECRRHGCRNILCDIYVRGSYRDDSFYICRGCACEFGRKHGGKLRTTEEHFEKLKQFLDTAEDRDSTDDINDPDLCTALDFIMSYVQDDT